MSVARHYAEEARAPIVGGVDPAFPAVEYPLPWSGRALLGARMASAASLVIKDSFPPGTPTSLSVALHLAERKMARAPARCWVDSVASVR